MLPTLMAAALMRMLPATRGTSTVSGTMLTVGAEVTVWLLVTAATGLLVAETG